MIDEVNFDSSGSYATIDQWEYPSSSTDEAPSVPVEEIVSNLLSSQKSPRSSVFKIDLNTARRKGDAKPVPPSQNLTDEKVASAAILTIEETNEKSKHQADRSKERKYTHKQNGLGGYLLGLGEIVLGGTLMVTGGAIEIGSLGILTLGFVVAETTGAALIGHGLSLTAAHAKKISHTAPPRTWKNVDVYAPDRPLPRDPRTDEPVPETDAPHTELGTQDGRKGKYPQAREFDGNGKPIRDIDFTDHGRPKDHPLPHQHESIPNPTGGTPKRDPEGKEVPEWDYK